ncbi:MAG: FAD-binding protein [Deltaproteobacteria bacterium]|nr:FAD-binding protein [Deltaproteobacteria bacterium]
MLKATARDEITGIVGKGNASFGKEELLCYSYDATNSLYPPDGVVFPGGPEEISRILRLANTEGFPVIPRGAGTGFTGGALAVEGGVILSLERLKGIREIDTANLTADVEPGVITGDLQAEAERLGLFYPPDPTSLKFSTIGGNIAECAGGPRAIKYGVTRDYVLGLEVVMPTGEIITTGTKKTMKGVVGYDLTRLMVGSEGTLGVVTRAFLRLLPLPEAKRTMLVEFLSLEDAAGAVEAVINAKVVPSTIEIIDDVCIRCVEKYAKVGGLASVEAVLLIEVDGKETGVQDDVARIRRIASERGAKTFWVASGRDEEKDIWNLRRAISPSLSKVKPTKLNEDVVVPRSNLVGLITGIEDIASKKGVVIASFGHAGDGNIHVNVMVDKNNAAEMQRGMDAVKDIFELTISLGGTISGEHGIGIAKASYIGMELSAEAIEVMRGIKKALDPNGILNPGKIFPKAFRQPQHA